MSSPQKLVETAAELVAACRDTAVQHIVVRGDISNAPSMRLGPGQRLAGEGDDASISFVSGVDGLQLSSDNDVRSLGLIASVDKRALFNDTGPRAQGGVATQENRRAGHQEMIRRPQNQPR
jgi:hypothetical protein